MAHERILDSFVAFLCSLYFFLRIMINVARVPLSGGKGNRREALMGSDGVAMKAEHA